MSPFRTLRAHRRCRIAAALLPCLLLAPSADADNLAQGVAHAVPVPEGRPPLVDGNLADWDLSGAEPCWIGIETVERQHAVIAYQYDDQALYVGATVALPGRAIHNPNRPIDRFWQGDLLQLRLASDPALPYPLTSRTDPALAANRRVLSISLWKNTATGEDIVHIQYGAKLDLGSVVGPEGSAIKIRAIEQGYVLEASIPWTALAVPDGRNPFKPGEAMTAVMEVIWGGGDQGRTSMHFHKDPGTFAFMNISTWGRIRFSPAGRLPPRHEGLAGILAAQRRREAMKSGTPVRFALPRRAKVSVNILDSDGAVIRELLGGEWHDAGDVVAWWDGRDAWGAPMPLGDYRWGAYWHDGLDVEYFGTVGTDGDPPYETVDGRGGWGGDHGPPIAAAADATGWYFVWNMNESGRAIVKTDFDGRVLWRVTPFVAGGWGNYAAAAANGRLVYLAIDIGREQHLVKLDAKTGDFLPFPQGSTLVLGLATNSPAIPPHATAGGHAFSAAGIACDGDTVYLSDYPGDRILVIDGLNGERTGEIACPGPRGLAFANGSLFAASFQAGSAEGAVLKIDPATGKSAPCVSELSAPWGVAVDDAGRLHVTDLGESQQVKVFAPDGLPLRTLGDKGGRPHLGAYRSESFLEPSGIAWDGRGGVIVAESSAPKVFTRIDAATGSRLRRWFGYTAYSPSNVPDSDDPLLQYYSLAGPDAFARARIPAEGGKGLPDASWDFVNGGLEDFGHVFDTMVIPEVVRANNGRKYLVPDGGSIRMPGRPRTLCRIEGDAMIPVARVCIRKASGAAAERLEIWTDANDDRRIQDDELAFVDEVGGRSFRWTYTTGSMKLCENGDLYLMTHDNAVVLVPGAGFTEGGAIRWDVDGTRVAIPEIVPGVKALFTSFRQGALGLRRDAEGNCYVLVNGDDLPYHTEALAKRMRTGMGHTSARNAVKINKYDPAGRLLWSVGRKATATPKPGEMMHHWAIGGLIGDAYVVACSEWGTFTVYTHDGFFVDALFDLPGVPGRGWPYTFGGEDFSGQIRHYPERDETWAYNCGHAYRITGIEKGRVAGEARLDGTVALARVEPLPDDDADVTSMQAPPLAEPAAQETAWADVPTAVLKDGGREIARFQVARTTTTLAFRARVLDDTPLVNAATALNAVFKGGDAVGIQIGPESIRSTGEATIGTTRLLAARIGGRDVLVAMKPATALEKRRETFTTPAGGTAAFDFLGEVPGGSARLVADVDGRGYTCLAEIPLTFLELDLAPGSTFAFEAEVLFSGQGQRGIGTVERHHLYSPRTPQTTLVNDTPTEARLHPSGWGALHVR